MDMDAMREVREGMRVLDSAGEDVGTVDELKMGDPVAETGEGQDIGTGSGLTGSGGRIFGTGESPVPRQQAERMSRLGYIKVDGKGLRSDFYVAGDQIDRVTDDVVQLTVERAELS